MYVVAQYPTESVPDHTEGGTRNRQSPANNKCYFEGDRGTAVLLTA